MTPEASDPWAVPDEVAQQRQQQQARPLRTPASEYVETQIVAASDVTDEVLEAAREVVSRFSPLSPTPWGKVWTGMDGRALADGSHISTGGRWGKDTPAKRSIKRALAPERKQAKEDALARREGLPTKAESKEAQERAPFGASWSGECAENSCNRRIEVGDPVANSKGRGWMHYTCAMRRWGDR